MNLIEQLKRDEGMKLKPYRDSVGKLTIGVGRNLDDVGISEFEAEMLLRNDIERSRRSVFEHLPWVTKLSEERRAALINMSFNMGVDGLLAFKNTLALVQAGDYDAASVAMLESKWATQVGIRSKRLSEQMKTGEWR